MSAARRRKKAWTRPLAKGYRARMLAQVRAFVGSPEFVSAGESLGVAQACGDLDGQRAALRAIAKGTVGVLAKSIASELAMAAIKKISRNRRAAGA